MKLTNIFYPKNIISLFYCLIIVKQKKGYNILILNKNYISRDLIKNYFPNCIFVSVDPVKHKNQFLNNKNIKSLLQHKNIKSRKKLKYCNHLI